MKEGRRPELPCPACGGQSYSWGKLRPQDGYFLAEDASGWRCIVGAGAKIRARRCDDCGNLQVFTEPDPSRVAKRARHGAEADFS